MSLDNDIARTSRKLRKISTVALPRANARVLNAAARTISARSVRDVSKQTKLKNKTIKNRFKIRRAKPKTQTSELTLLVRDVSAISQFSKARQSSLKLGKGTNSKGVTVAGRRVRRAFINRGKPSSSGKRNLQVFRRKGGPRLPIESIKFPIARRAIRQTKKHVSAYMSKEFPKKLLKELQFRARRA